MSLKRYIPFTQARRMRLMRAGFQQLASGADGLALIEWEDGSKTPKPVTWDSELSCLKTEDGKRFFARGRGAEPKSLLGVPVWDVNASQLGVVATEAALLSDREEYDEVYDASDIDDIAEVSGRAPNGPQTPTDGDATNGAAATDGGFPSPESADGAAYNLNPPRDFDGEAISVSLPMKYDPFPASQRDAEQAVTQAKQAAEDTGEKLMWLIIGGGIVLAVWFLMTVVPWLMRQIGGSVDAGEASQTLSSGGGAVVPAVVDTVAQASLTLAGALPTVAGGALP